MPGTLFVSTAAHRRFLLLALLICAVPLTVSANPGWHRLRCVLVVLWFVSHSGTLFSIFSVRPGGIADPRPRA
jgi:hypothetical protein